MASRPSRKRTRTGRTPSSNARESTVENEQFSSTIENEHVSSTVVNEQFTATGARTEYWTSERYRSELRKLGFRIPASVSRKVLIALYKENCEGHSADQPSPDEVPTPEPAAGHSTDSCNVFGSGGLREATGQSELFAQTLQSLQQSNAALQQTVNLLIQKTSAEKDTGYTLQSFYTDSAALPNSPCPITISDERPMSTVSPPATASAPNATHAYSLPSVRSPFTQGTQGVSAANRQAIDLVTPEQRKQVLEGKDVNLICLLIPSYVVPSISKDKNKDKRLNKKLTIQEFIIAFGVYKRIMCQAYNWRRAELDAYEAHIIDMASSYPDHFYEYHKLFSAQCAIALEQHKLKIDWSQGDYVLRERILRGVSPVKCDNCGSAIHSTALCEAEIKVDSQHSSNATGYYGRRNFKSLPSKSGSSGIDMHYRPRVFHNGVEVCNNWNDPRGCNNPQCRRLHVCRRCRSQEHQSHNCIQASVAKPDSAQPLLRNKPKQHQNISQ